jgi:hypothetical protein
LLLAPIFLLTSIASKLDGLAARKRHMSAIRNALLATELVLALALTVAWGGQLAYG